MIKDPDLEIICSRQRGRDPDTPAMKLASEIVEHKGPGPRRNRNRLAFLAPANGQQSPGQASIMRTKPTIDEFAGTRVAKQATTTIPIVMAISGDAIATGLVSSLARPEANLTGSTQPATSTLL